MCTTLRQRGAASAVIISMAAIVALMTEGALPADAQYGDGGVTIVTEPRVAVGDTFSVFGNGCDAGETVEISIDGRSDVLGAAAASPGGGYSFADITLPSGVVAGTDHEIRATCRAQTNTALMTVLCRDGSMPVDGACPDVVDRTISGIEPAAAAGVIPAPTSERGGDAGTSGDDPPATSADSSDPATLAITGASFSELATKGAVTLIAVGIVLVRAAQRRHPESTGDVC